MKKIFIVPVIILTLAAGLFAAAENIEKPDKKTVDEYFKKAVIYEEQGKYREAAGMFEIVLWADNKYPKVVFHLAHCYKENERYEDAIKLLQKHLKAKPKDKDAIALLSECESLIKEYRQVKLKVKSNTGQIVFKSPATAYLHSFLDYNPVSMLVPHMSLIYAREGTNRQDYSMFESFSVLLGLIADLDYVIGAFINYSSDNEKDPATRDLKRTTSIVMLYLGLGLTTAAIECDAILGSITATENAVKYVVKCRNNRMELDDKNMKSYKEPILAMALNFAVPGTGYFYLDEFDKGLSNMLIVLGLDIAAFFQPFLYINNMATEEETMWNRIAFGTGWLAFFHFLSGTISAFNVGSECDVKNAEYYKQLLCKNSPFKIVSNMEPKDPGTALLIAATLGLIVPGAGNFYVDNQQAGYTLIAERACAGLLIGFNWNHKNNGWVSEALFYSGCTLAAITYMIDVYSAPGYASIYNAAFTKEGDISSVPDVKLSLYPYFMPDGAGINVAYSF